jgi:hypothetical protein
MRRGLGWLTAVCTALPLLRTLLLPLGLVLRCGSQQKIDYYTNP